MTEIKAVALAIYGYSNKKPKRMLMNSIELDIGTLYRTLEYNIQF
jgi:hypothetical protein